MAHLDRRPEQWHGARSRLTRVAALALAGAVALVAVPASAGPSRARPAAKVAAKTKAALLPVEGSACLFPIPGQECSEEERRLCDAPPAPDPVVVDCHDPANAWVQEMVGECDMPHLSDAAVGERDRERPRDGACLDAGSCGGSTSTAAPINLGFDYQPAVGPTAAWDHRTVQRLRLAPEILRRHPGYPRGVEHPPRS